MAGPCGFRPEFLNRLDEIVIFHPLSDEHLANLTYCSARRTTRQARPDAGFFRQGETPAAGAERSSGVGRVPCGGSSSATCRAACRLSAEGKSAARHARHYRREQEGLTFDIKATRNSAGCRTSPLNPGLPLSVNGEGRGEVSGAEHIRSLLKALNPQRPQEGGALFILLMRRGECLAAFGCRGRDCERHHDDAPARP